MIISNENLRKFINMPDFDKNPTDLCELLSKYESDKSSRTKIYNGWHNYSGLYSYIFNDLKDKDVNFFEVGVYKGASIRSFREYFKNGQIYAGDIDPGYFFPSENINFYVCDQDNPESIKHLFDSLNVDFDIIIDDGKHEFYSNLNMLKNSIHRLKKNGIYIIEDLRFDVVDKFKPILSNLKNEMNLSFIDIFIIDHPTNKIDNNLVIIQK